MHKITKSSIFNYFTKYILWTLGLTFIVFVFAFYLGYINKQYSHVYIIALIFMWFICFGFPLIFLFVNHIRKNKVLNFSILNNNYFSLNENLVEHKFHLDEIESIKLIVTYQEYKKTIDFQFYGKYHYTEIILKNGKTFKISCLVFDQTEKLFPAEKITKKKRWFPLL